MRTPDFENILRVLNRQKPTRPTLFEFFMNGKVYEHFTKRKFDEHGDFFEAISIIIGAFHKAGYDYATIPTWFTNTLAFLTEKKEQKETISINEGAGIHDRESFEKYPWPDPDKGEYDIYDKIAQILPDGMKAIVCGHSGVLENVIALVGYEQLCIMSMMDEELTKDIFDAVGSRLTRYYEICASIDCVGALISNDDWGFKTQTMLSPEMMRKYVIPWHAQIVKAIHHEKKPALLHSCGNLEEVMEDIIEVCGFDAKHSYEDAISPVEEMYEKWHSRIAILGGIDMDFLTRSTPQEIYSRSKKMLERSANDGGYALGSGNSIPEFIPIANYEAMLSAAL